MMENEEEIKAQVEEVAMEKPLAEMTDSEIKAAVAKQYGRVATNPDGRFDFPVGRKFAESVGYSPEMLDKVPSSMWESFTGAGNPQPYIDIVPGETVLDLGCGAGLDLYLYAQATGASGRVYGLDISVDLVAANGIYNLSPDKIAVMREVARVLRSGGRTLFAEIVLKAPLPEEIRRNITDWFRCIGGALPKSNFIECLESVGLNNPRILWIGRNARTGHELSLCAVIRAEKKG